MKIAFNPIRTYQDNYNKTYNQNPMNNGIAGTVSDSNKAFGLNKDTISFTGSGQLLSDSLRASFQKNSDRMQRIATTYLDVLESIAFKLKEKGVSFDRAYGEMNCVKSPESATSKVIRSKKMNIPDAVRASLYVKNPYDMSLLFNDILPAFKKRGYILSKSEMSIAELEKRGYYGLTEEMLQLPDQIKKETKLMVQDIDIRLDKSMIDESNVPSEFSFALSKPQKSGYEDIQMRLVRDFDKKEAPVEHELILIFGPDYAEAKHLESDMIYSSLRKFGEINMKTNLSSAPYGSNAFKAKRYVDLINEVATGKFSKKLFENAKNKNYYDIDDSIPIVFSEQDSKVFNNYFSGLRDRFSDFCNELMKANKNNPVEKKKITSDIRKDKAIIKEIQKELNANFKFLLSRFNSNSASNV